MTAAQPRGGRPLVIGIGGTAHADSSTEKALRLSLAAAERLGAEVRLFGSEALVSLPHFLTAPTRCAAVDDLLQAYRAADGVIFASPGYHGSIAALVKNAIEYLELTATDDRVYLDGLPVGLIATAYGWQATGSTLLALRSIVHALRGWPTPLGATVKCSSDTFVDGRCTDPAAAAQLDLVGVQVVEFAQLRRAAQEAAMASG